VCLKVKFSTFNQSLSLKHIKKKDLKLKFSLFKTHKLEYSRKCILKFFFCILIEKCVEKLSPSRFLQKRPIFPFETVRAFLNKSIKTPQTVRAFDYF
jgi:hypothetical protein